MSETPVHGYADNERRYRLDARIATGGMGEVWRATDTTLGREVAVKLLKQEYADDPTFRARFETEARHAASLHHPNIAAVYDFGETDTVDGSGAHRPYLVMELVDGQPLSALIQGGRAMSPAAVRELLAQAADGLGAAHAAGIVHRDVKPANLIVTPDRRVKVTDFGIARAAEGMGLTGTGEVMGTPQYLSPEQAQGQPSTPASDVYSLGVVAFECLAGTRPFVADTAVATALAHLREPVPDLPDSVPSDLAAVVHRSMAKLPQDRFQDGDALAEALRHPATAATKIVPAAVAPVHPGPPPPVTTTMPVVDEPEERRRSAVWPVLAVIALVAVAILVVLLITSGDDDENPSDEETSQTPSETVSSTPSEPTSEATTEDTSVTLNAGDYVGRPLGDVERELGQLGLRVNSVQVDNPGDRIEGDVSALNPTGRVEQGDTITVSYWGPQPPPSDTPTPTPTPTDSATPTPDDSTSPSS
ncbi:protein kinase [Nocardioides sp. SR21]|uniref:protein kinase domain-containing protein n=1 Tax=Nocardioides sp. SR21 TaxID=2919501 RepID=UPI001FA9625A|nr:protein kinase [Nocardioides sp. SR21]